LDLMQQYVLPAMMDRKDESTQPTSAERK
jgi:hypothetical protein